MKAILLFIVLLFGSSWQTNAQPNSTKPLLVKQLHRHQIQSDVLNQTRVLDVFLPTNYYTTSEFVTYPVIYLLDGEFLFHPISGAVQHLSSSSLMPDSIVVSINNFEQAPQVSSHVDTEERVDVMPKLYQDGETAGWGNYRAKEHLLFLKNELLPFVEKHYRTNDFKILTGLSPTATFALYVAWQDVELFDAYIAVNHWPLTLQDDKNKSVIDNLVNSFSHSQRKKYLYLSQLDFLPEDTQQTLEEYETLNQRLSTEKASNLTHQTEVISGYGYNTVLSAFTSAMNIIFPRSMWEVKFRKFKSDVKGESFANMQSYYTSLKKKYGFDVIPKLRKWWSTGDDLLALSRRTKDKLETLQYAVHLYGRSANAHTYLADELEQRNQLSKALTLRKKAVELAKENGNIRLPVYEQNLRKLTSKIASHN